MSCKSSLQVETGSSSFKLCFFRGQLEQELGAQPKATVGPLRDNRGPQERRMDNIIQIRQPRLGSLEEGKEIRRVGGGWEDTTLRANRRGARPSQATCPLVLTRKRRCALCSGVTLICQMAVVTCLFHTGLKGRMHVKQLTWYFMPSRSSKHQSVMTMTMNSIETESKKLVPMNRYEIFYFFTNWGHMKWDNSCFVYKIRKNKRGGFPEPVKGRKMNPFLCCCREWVVITCLGSIW